MNAPTNHDEVIDSRDVIARIEELTDERRSLVDAVEEAEETLADADDTTADFVKEEAEEQLADDRAALAEWDTDNAEELKALTALAEEAEDSPDWKYGETLIRRSYFETYAQELAEDCGMLENANSWPLTCIDWGQAARELEQDYMSVDFDGVEYLIRA